MHDGSKTGLRLAGLLVMAVCLSHCGDSSVHIRTGNGTNPTPGAFAGVTDQGGTITIQVGSIEAIAFECNGEPLSATFSPPREVNGDGTFDVQFSDGGRKFHVSGRFTDNDTAAGIIDDADNACDTGFEATRNGGPIKTATPKPTGPTRTPNGSNSETATETPTTSPTSESPGTLTVTPTGGTPTPTPTSTGPTCPTLITFTGTSTTGVLDTGWTGNGHDSTVVGQGTVTVSVTHCAGTAPNCGLCNYTGPVRNAAGQIQVQRCSNDSSIPCTSSGACGGGTCKFFFGSYLPLAAGGISTCVENTFNGSLTGTANIGAGTSAGSANIISRVFLGDTLSNPCPQCLGDTTLNDGVKGGTCSKGTKNGQLCDASGASPNASFGTTSLDCPPDTAKFVGAIPIDLSNTTGNKVRTLSAANPNCSKLGFTTNKCQCDTCDNAAATPCSSNADCGASGICGGKRCNGGTSNGTPCGDDTDCPGGGCGVPGTPTQPNQCDHGSGDCVSDSGNERICSSGPFETFCGPVETFRGCSVNTDCKFPGDTCSGGRFRKCFDNGVIGETVTASGQADPPTNHQSDPTLAALFCIGPTTTSPSVNLAAGLPGLGRLELGGHATDNGTL